MVKELSLSKISLDEFEEWLTQASWNMHRYLDANDEAQRLVGAVELCLAEASGKTYRELLEELESIAGYFQIGEGPVIATGANVQTVPVNSRLESLADVDRQPEMVFG